MGFWWVGTGLNDETRLFAQGYAGDLEIHGVGLRTLGLRPQFSARSPQFGVSRTYLQTWWRLDASCSALRTISLFTASFSCSHSFHTLGFWRPSYPEPWTSNPSTRS